MEPGSAPNSGTRPIAVLVLAMFGLLWFALPLTRH